MQCYNKERIVFVLIILTKFNVKLSHSTVIFELLNFEYLYQKLIRMLIASIDRFLLSYVAFKI